ncbi:hypothetical protein [Eubacterium sp.]|jgi:thymidylate kinase|uniref:hypothetical protein n=1 Tax=Eubacterium sp. TaxID=142586 RepID=UPI003A8E548F
MIIIVEGVDRVGKTTLCNMLRDELGFTIYKHNNECFEYSRMDNDNETDKMLQLIDLYKQVGNGSNLIFDRFHWSDYVYGKFERKYEEIKAVNNLQTIEEKLKEVNAIIVYVEPTNIDVSSSKHGKSLLWYDYEMKECFERSDLSKIKANYDSLNDVVEFVAEELYKEKTNVR